MQIIYVDADQVSRVDLSELWDMDIHDCVYAYTPLCTSNQETKGFMVEKQMEGKVTRSSGLRDSGRIICEESRITSVLCIRWILRWMVKMDWVDV